MYNLVILLKQIEYFDGNKILYIRTHFRWRKKQHFQKKDIAIQKMLLQCIDTQRQKFIEDYNKKINKETARMQSKIDDKY
jgi:hypothetical protein